MSDVPESQQLEKIAEVPVAAPKKRGRKRKSEIALQQVKEVVDIKPVEKNVSRRGRPRKKVNYYDLANPDNLDFPIPLENQLALYNLENYEQNKKIKIEKNSSLTRDLNKLPHANEESDDKLHNNSLEGSETIKNGSHQDISIPISNEIIDSSNSANTSSEDATTNSEAATSTPNKDKKYNYTGETVKMMNTLFNLFNTDENKAQDSANKLDNTTTNSRKNGKRAYRKSKKHNTDEIKVEDSTVTNISCAVCNASMEKSLWTHHKQRYHNNLAWRVGDPPLDLTDQSFVMHTLNMLYKKKKPLYCDKCHEVKKSVVGFLSHRSQCLKSEEQLESVKIACELCGRKMLPVSMSTHMKMLHSSGSDKGKNEAEKQSSEINKPLSSKRSAAKKAMRIIETVTKNDDQEKYFTRNLDLGSQEFARELMQKELDETQFFECKFGCNCITTNMQDALKHLEECTEKLAEGFVCKRCLVISGTLEEIINHVELNHEIDIDKDESFDPGFAERESSSKLPAFLASPYRKIERILFPFAFEWTFKFCEENFSAHHLEDMDILKSNWTLLPRDQATNYLPKLNESCDVARTHITSFINPLSNKYEYVKYKLFESEVHDNKITLFCGGPISSLAWVPTPYLEQSENQVLAVSVLNSPDEKYLTCENFYLDCAIQFWNFGPLQNKAFSLQKPKLMFGLAHSHGPVWHMEWCPSGCYKGDRMGLLAVTGTDSVVYIYAIPLLSESERGLFYKAKPVMKLLLQRTESPLLGGLKYYPSKISWSKAAGHQYISVGYTNGFVALFNIKTSSCILKFEDSTGIPCILPSKCFQAHSHAITVLALHHLNGGCKWLLTGSFDRRVSVWDLDNHSYPISNTKKNIVTDGFWFTNWMCFGTACDEGSTSTYVTSVLKQVRDYLSDPSMTLSGSYATISALSGSDWVNSMVHANTVGEIIAVFPHQLLNFGEYSKILKTKRMLFGYTCLLEKQKTPQERLADDLARKKTLSNLSTKKLSAGYKVSSIKPDIDHDSLFVNEPILYDEAAEKYAVLFCDNKMNSYEDFPKTTAKQLTVLSKTYGVTRPNLYPLTTINKIVFNPNRQASLYYAAGYQAGFVRISWMEFLKDDYQIK